MVIVHERLGAEIDQMEAVLSAEGSSMGCCCLYRNTGARDYRNKSWHGYGHRLGAVYYSAVISHRVGHVVRAFDIFSIATSTLDCSHGFCGLEGRRCVCYCAPSRIQPELLVDFPPRAILHDSPQLLRDSILRQSWGKSPRLLLHSRCSTMAESITL